MKFHWGHGIAIFFSLFVIIMLLVLFQSRKERVDLVTEDYYGEELKYQERIDQAVNSKELGLSLTACWSDSSLVIVLPDTLRKDPELSGRVHLYRPSGSEMDIISDLAEFDSSTVHIPLKRLHPGRYIIKAEIASRGKSYYLEQDLDY